MNNTTAVIANNKAITFYDNYQSPLGALLLLSDGDSLTGLYMDAAEFNAETRASWREDDSRFIAVRAQLDAYFAGELRRFELPLAPQGSAFQQTVWSALHQIPYGATISYGEQAVRLGKPNAARAVGLANGRNPISIIVPCHRVIGASGALTGYGGGIERKRWLLCHEGALLA